MKTSEETPTGSKHSREPIAIVGIGCRFPGGANSPKAFWKLLCDGKDAIVDIPKDRWDIRRFYDEDPDKPGKMYVKQGGFLKEKIDHFDPLFFGISPREAESMDPQQRLLLEVTWEAFEDAGITAEELDGSKTGVFIGGFCLDNMLAKMGPLSRELSNSHTAASSTLTMLSNRISYIFNLTGPSLSIDTACSSSLVATHYACQSIWNRESKTALAGGVNVMLRPEFPIAMSKGKFLSTDGRCKAFDAEAAGYTRGEGAGIVVLKSLKEALEGNDRIYGLIRGTGANQDGRTAGISLPSSSAQESLVRNVYRESEIAPNKIGYVEAHGTGTQAGDPLELKALDAVLREDRPEGEKCIVGSVKTNIGHLEGAAGVAGLIKASLSLYHEKIVPNLHFKTPNPNIPFDEYCVEVSSTPRDWKRSVQPRFASVNSFGYGGTNAHALLQEAPSTKAVPDSDGRPWEAPYILPISARSESSLQKLAAKYAFLLTTKNSPQELADFLYTATERRSHHKIRLALIADSPENLRDKLQSYSSDKIVENAHEGYADESDSGLIYIYTGMGPQWWGMGRELFEKETVFNQSVKRCDEVFASIAGWSILDEMLKDENDSRMSKTEVAQPANFVIQAGLTDLWKSWGIQASFAIGHSVGEVASAYASGALSLEDSMKVSFHRSRLQQTTAGQGSMLAVGLPEEEAEELIRDYPNLSVAAINSLSSVTLSGNRNELLEVSKQLQERGVFNRSLNVEIAYHSPQMDSIKEELISSLSSIQPMATKIPLVSTVTGTFIDGKELDSKYWWKNVREPVRFRQGIESLLKSETSSFLEVGPHPVLGHSVKEIAASKSRKIQLAPSLNRKRPEHLCILDSLGQLYTRGFKIAWEKVIPPKGRFIQLPTYPWQKEKHWSESEKSLRDRLGENGHIFLNNRIASPIPTWTVELNSQFFPYIKDHVVNDQIIFPGAGYVEAGLALGRANSGSKICLLADVEFRSLLQFDNAQLQTVSFNLDDRSGQYGVYSKTGENTNDWQQHASGQLVLGDYKSPHETYDLSTALKAFDEELQPKEMYAMLHKRGLQYGEFFQIAKRVLLGTNDVLVQAEKSGRENDGYILPPEVLDTAFHSLLTLIEGELPFVPQKIGKIVFLETPPKKCWIHGTITSRSETSFYANIQLLDSEGEICVELFDVFMKALPKTQSSEKNSIDDLLYKLDWEEFNLESGEPTDDDNQYLIFSDESDLALEIVSSLTEKGKSWIKVIKGSSVHWISPTHAQMSGRSRNDFDWILNKTDDGRPLRILYFWANNIDQEKLDYEQFVERTLEFIYLVQSLKKRESKDCSISTITRNSQPFQTTQKPGRLNSSSLWGLGQLVENECDNIRCSFVDLDSPKPLQNVNSLIEHIINGRHCDIALRNGKIYTRVLKRTDLLSDEQSETVSTDHPVTFSFSNQNQSGHALHRALERRKPNPGEIEIQVHAASIDAINERNPTEIQSFRSVYEKNASPEASYEVCGEVVNCGDSVTNLQPGDKVAAIVNNHLSSYVIAPVERVAKVPNGVSIDEFFIFSSFFVAHYAVVAVGHLEAGESILIHNATDPVGLAAIGIAKTKKARIFATAETDTQREFLRSLGVLHVFDSSSLDFALRIRQATVEKGINIILNRLSGNARSISVELLAEFGRFIEIGETNSESLNPEAHGNSIFAKIDINQIVAQRPDLTTKSIQEIVSLLDTPNFGSIPQRTFPANKILDAFEYATSKDRIGRTAIRYLEEQVQVSVQKGTTLFSEDPGSYIVTGGNSGLGLEIAKWLASKSSKRIILASRRGRTPEAMELIESLGEKGITVQSEAVDVTNLEEVKALVQRLEEEGESVRGIFHGAMVLDDCLIENLTEERLRRVVEPKVLGAINLYESVKHLDLEFFISFSSVASLIGNRGQTAYIAANAFLETFANHLALEKKHAQSVNLGPLSDTGIVARNELIGKLLEQEGVALINNQDLFTALERIIRSSFSQVGVFRVDWRRWKNANPNAASSHRLKYVLAEADRESSAVEKKGIAQELEKLDYDQQHKLLSEKAIGGLSRVLRISPEKIDIYQTLDSMGIDSLMLIELSLVIQSDFQVNIPAAELHRYPNIESLVTELLERLGGSKEKAAI